MFVTDLVLSHSSQNNKGSLASLMQLPAEILLLVIENIEDKPSLTRLSYVCKSSYYLIQPYLYHSVKLPIHLAQSNQSSKVEFGCTETTYLLHRSLAEEPKLRSYIRSLEICFSAPKNERYKFNWDSMTDIVACWPTLHEAPFWSALIELVYWACKSIQVFKISNEMLSKLLEPSERALCQLIPHMQNLKGLDIRLAFDINPNILAALLQPDVRLTSLVLFQQSAPRPQPYGQLHPTPLDDEQSQPMLNALQSLSLNFLESIETWINILPVFGSLRTLELTSDELALDPVLRAPYSLEKVLLPLPHLSELTLNLFATRNTLSLNDLKISGLHNLSKFNIVGWTFQPTTSVFDLCESLFAGNLSHFSWDYEETSSSNINLTENMISVLGEALKSATKLKNVQLVMGIFVGDTSRILEIEEALSRVERELSYKGIRCDSALSTFDSQRAD